MKKQTNAMLKRAIQEVWEDNLEEMGIYVDTLLRRADVDGIIEKKMGSLINIEFMSVKQMNNFLDRLYLLEGAVEGIRNTLQQYSLRKKKKK